MRDLNALYDTFHPRGVRVVGISVDVGDERRVRAFSEDEKLAFGVAHDTEQRVQ
jgi:peroxiredoxin